MVSPLYPKFILMAKNNFNQKKKTIDGEDGYGDSKEPSISPEAVHALLGKARWDGDGDPFHKHRVLHAIILGIELIMDG